MRIPTTEQMRGELARREHVRYIKYLWQRQDPFIVGQHTAVIGGIIDGAIARFRNGESTRICIKVPFRHGKSDLVSRYLPTRFIGEFPDDEVIVAAYSASLARTFSRFARTIMRDERYQNVYPGVCLSEDEASVDEWGIQGRTGKVHWAGIGGSITGKGGSCIVIDDFFSGREEAESEVIRDKVWASITNDILTRAAPVSIIIILATPWHVDDAFGRIEKRAREDVHFPVFETVTMPAYSETYPSGVLFPERFSREWYDTQSALLGPYGTASLLQCNPVIREGNLLKIDNLQYYDGREDLPDEVVFTRGWDLASTEKQRVSEDPDYTVGVRLGVVWHQCAIPGQMIPEIYIDDVVRGRWEAPERDEVIRGAAIADGPIEIGVESVAGYKDTYTHLVNTLRGMRSVRAIRLPGDKVNKWQVLEPIFAAGNVHIRRGTWNEAAVEEIGTVPGAAHDDIVDAIRVAYELHRPHTARVWETFFATNVVPLNIAWERAVEFPKLHYGALTMGKDMRTYWIGALWDNRAAALYVYGEKVWGDFDPRSITNHLTSAMHMRQCRVDRLFGGKILMGNTERYTRSVDQLLREEYKQRKLPQPLRLSAPINYDFYGSIAEVDTLFRSRKLYIGENCPETARQAAGWIIENGKPSEEDIGFCECLCLIGSELRRKQVTKPIRKLVDYARKEVVEKKLREDPMLKGRSL